MAYQYKPLSNPKTEIRVALVQPGDYDDEIRISFRTRRLANVTSSLLSRQSCKYEALSYVWGSKDNPSHVRVGSRFLNLGNITITRNLDVALRHLRHKAGPRLIWIDALCINQSNDDEKSIQVAMMGRIFSLARSVVAWLGPEENNSNDTLELMRHLAHHVEVKWGDNTLHPSVRSNDHTWADTNIRLPYTLGEFDFLCKLLERPYFERTWVRQEIILATCAVLQCGQHQILWQDFRTAIGCISWKSHNRNALVAYRKSEFRKLRRIALDFCDIAQLYLTYSNLRVYSRDSKCQDPRDRIYATLTLLRPRDQRLGIEPDYSRAVEELYADVAGRAIIGHRSLDLLGICELPSRALDVPSWVPDWSSRLKAKGTLSTKWSACAWISAQAIITADNKLCATGTIAVPIEHVTEFDIDENDWSYDGMLRTLREVRPSGGSIVAGSDTRLNCIIRYCQVLSGNWLADSYIPPREGFPSLEACTKLFDIIWSTNANWDELTRPNWDEQRQEKYLLFRSILDSCRQDIIGRSFFLGTNGYIGLVPAGTRTGDVVCVLLGCSHPVVLRSSSESGWGRTWQVVGACHAPGLMNGEAIYGNKLPAHYRSIWQQERNDDLIDGSRAALYDPETQTFKTDPAKVLTEMGIKVESYQREPHLLEVLPETLRAAGVALQDFTLV